MHRTPPLPGTIPGWQQTAAKLCYFGLYVCMVVIPLSATWAVVHGLSDQVLRPHAAVVGLDAPRLKELVQPGAPDRGRDLHHTDRDSRRGRAEAPVVWISGRDFSTHVVEPRAVGNAGQADSAPGPYIKARLNKRAVRHVHGCVTKESASIHQSVGVMKAVAPIWFNPSSFATEANDAGDAITELFQPACVDSPSSRGSPGCCFHLPSGGFVQSYGLESRPVAKAYLRCRPMRTADARATFRNGAFKDVRRMLPADELIPYDLVVPFWSDPRVKAALDFRSSGQPSSSAKPLMGFPGGNGVHMKTFEMTTDEASES